MRCIETTTGIYYLQENSKYSHAEVIGNISQGRALWCESGPNFTQVTGPHAVTFFQNQVVAVW